MRVLRKIAALTLLAAVHIKAFTTSSTSPRLGWKLKARGSRLFAESDLSYGSMLSLPNDFRTFLNQCSIQSFLFLLRQVRDVQTVKYMGDFTRPALALRKRDLPDEESYNSHILQDGDTGKNPTKFLQYHGLAALNTTIFPTWEAYFNELLDQPDEVLVIESDKPHIPSYELDIKPASLCARLLSVREQIAQEWVRDLDVIASMGGNTFEAYLEAVRKQRDEQPDAGVSDIHIERQNLLFLEWDPNEDSDYAPSPLRKGNFDLLTLLTTQEAIHRLLNDESRRVGSVDAAANDFLYKFYMERAESFFVGIQRYGRADDFIEALLNSSPIVTSNALIDPTKLVEDIMERREEVALDWKEIARDSPQEHFHVRKKMLNKLMGVNTEQKAS